MRKKQLLILKYIFDGLGILKKNLFLVIERVLIYPYGNSYDMALPTNDDDSYGLMLLIQIKSFKKSKNFTLKYI